jgi:hypothetical protein
MTPTITHNGTQITFEQGELLHRDCGYREYAMHSVSSSDGKEYTATGLYSGHPSYDMELKEINEIELTSYPQG